MTGSFVFLERSLKSLDRFELQEIFCTHIIEAPLWQLCKQGNLAKVREAIARGEDVNGKDEGKWTALMLAIFERDTEIVKLLLDQPTVDLNCTNFNGQTALHVAAWKDNVEALKMLLVDPRLTTYNHKNNYDWTPAMMAAHWKKAGALRELVAHPSVDLDTKDSFGRSLEEVARWS